MSEAPQAFPLLSEVAPELMSELQRLLLDQSEPDLADKVAGLAIVELCPCSDDFCATFYTAPRHRPGPARGSRTIQLAPAEGYLNVDVDASDILGVEILFRDELRARIRAALP
jgi:hypothetical protein